MQMQKRFAAAVILMLFATPAPAAPSKEEARSSAEAWVALVDAGKYGESWTEASAIFQSGISKEKWEQTVKKVRDDFGPLLSRKPLQVALANSLPGVPDGEYAVVQYNTSFEKKASAVETITLTAEGGKWKAAGYFIR
jgi:hypothetical protein